MTWTPIVLGSTTPGTCTYVIQNGTFSGPQGDSEDENCTTLVSAHISWTDHTGTGNLRISLPCPVEGGNSQVGQFICQNMPIPGLVGDSFVFFSVTESRAIPTGVRNNDTLIEFPITQSGDIWITGWYLSTHE